MKNEELKLVTDLPRLVNDVVAQALPLIGDSSRTGGYFCLSRRSGRVLLVVLAGEIALDEKAQKYAAFCQEKCLRLSQHQTHCSSFQSRDESLNQFGGSIAAQDYILGFSGGPEKWDEACMLEVVRREPRFKLSFAAYAEIIRASNNEFVTDTFAGFER